VEEHKEKMAAAPAGAPGKDRSFFDRDRDLAIRRPVVGKEREKMFKDAKNINDNFSSGSFL
jgi:hypothetical protein